MDRLSPLLGNHKLHPKVLTGQQWGRRSRLSSLPAGWIERHGGVEDRGPDVLTLGQRCALFEGKTSSDYRGNGKNVVFTGIFL